MGTHWPLFADEQDIEAQLARLDSRGHRTEAYLALNDTHTLLEAHWLTGLGRLGLANSRNHARHVRTTNGEQAVLKLTTVVRGYEAGALLNWQQHGLAGTRTAAVYAHGHTDNGYEWSIQQLLPGTSLKLADGPNHLDAAITLARELATPARGLPDLLSLLEQRLASTATQTPSRSASITTDILRQLRRTRFDANVTSHGDYGANNLLHSEGRLRTIDPAGYAAPPAYDVACFLGRSTAGNPVTFRTIEKVAADANVGPDQLSVLTACELVDTARELNRTAIGRTPEDLLTDAEQLLRNYRS